MGKHIRVQVVVVPFKSVPKICPDGFQGNIGIMSLQSKPVERPKSDIQSEYLTCRPYKRFIFDQCRLLVMEQAVLPECGIEGKRNTCLHVEYSKK